MQSRKIIKLTTAGVFFAFGMGICGPVGVTSIAFAGDRSPEAKRAADASRQAEIALRKGQHEEAVAHAEIAVGAEPSRADYRLILAQSYMRAGRFTAAATTYGDVLELDPSNGRAALNLALMQTALGRKAAALETLDTHREKIAAADFGLAVALAGDAESAVRILEAAVRAEGSDARARQNLALAFALSGRWVHARIMAARDVPYDQLNARMEEWAQFARPATDADQVAALMGVTPVQDAGQPQRLALNLGGGTTVALAEPQPVEAAAVPAAAEAAAPSVAQDEAPRFEVPAPVAAPAKSVTIALDAPAPMPAPVRRVDVPAAPSAGQPEITKPIVRVSAEAPRQMIVPAVVRDEAAVQPVEGGRFAVQLGAYSSQARAELAWDRATRRIGALAGHSASTAKVRVLGMSLYRLSVTGFASRQVAGQVCTRIRNAGGSCFVRTIAGDKPMQWVNRGGTRLAARR